MRVDRGPAGQQQLHELGSAIRASFDQVLIAATVLLLPVGVLGMFSIGFPLFLGGLLTLVSACDSAVPYRTDHRAPQ